MNARFRVPALAAAALALGAAGCTSFTNPATGKSSYLWISRDQEHEWGQQVYDEMKKKPGYAPTASAEHQRLEQVTRRVLSVSDDRTWDYQIHVLQTDEVNAFAAPGGFVFCTLGLLKMVASDDELAGVMAHEAGHVAAKHTAFRMQQAMVANGVAAVLGAGAEAYTGNKNAGELASKGAAVAGNFVLLGYSRSDEYEADKLGVRYSYKAGYNPEGFVTFFEKLEKMEKKSGGGNIPSFFSTHPSTPDRIKKVKDEIADVRSGRGEPDRR
jgi:predicted Zn-dependent protease